MTDLSAGELQRFTELEHAGWENAAGIYDPLLGTFTQHAVERLLDATGVGKNTRVLDVACGPGYAASYASSRGAAVTGIDFSAAMVAEARRRFPRTEFRQGDAHALPFEATVFDAVICNFGLLHFAQPDEALAEAYRVLVSGGRYAFTVWSGPAQGPSYFSLLFGAIQAHANMDVPLPPAPPLFRFSDHEECRRALRAAGFVDSAVTAFHVMWYPPSADTLLEFIERCAVRGRMLIDQQSSDVRERIYGAIRQGAQQFLIDGRLAVPWPAVLATARKP